MHIFSPPNSRALGVHETVDAAAAAIDLKSSCNRLAANQKWSAGKLAEIERAYRKTLSQFALAFEGFGLVANINNDIALLWQEHCLEGAKYAQDMLALSKALLSFKGKPLNEKIPGPVD